VYLRVCVCVCVLVCVRASVHVCECMNVYVCACMYLCVCFSLSLSLSLSLSRCLCAHVCVCVCVQTYMFYRVGKRAGGEQCNQRRCMRNFLLAFDVESIRKYSLVENRLCENRSLRMNIYLYQAHSCNAVEHHIPAWHVQQTHTRSDTCEWC